MNASRPPCLDASRAADDPENAATVGVMLNQDLNLTNGLRHIFMERKLLPCQPCSNVTSLMTSSGGLLGTDSMASDCVQFYPAEIAARDEQYGLVKHDSSPSVE